jgi:hypothetical protein
MRAVAGQATPATVALRRAGVAHTLHADDHNSGAYGAQAAAALGQDPARVLTTLVATVDGAVHVAVVPVGGTLRGPERPTGLIMGYSPDSPACRGKVPMINAGTARASP